MKRLRFAIISSAARSSRVFAEPNGVTTRREGVAAGGVLLAHRGKRTNTRQTCIARINVPCAMLLINEKRGLKNESNMEETNGCADAGKGQGARGKAVPSI